MKANDQHSRIFANLSIGLLVSGLLVPFVIDVLFAEELAMGFQITAVLLALVFGVLGWGRRAGKVAVVLAGAFFMWSGGVSLWLMRREHAARMEEQVMREKAAAREVEVRASLRE